MEIALAGVLIAFLWLCIIIVLICAAAWVVIYAIGQVAPEWGVPARKVVSVVAIIAILIALIWFVQRIL